MVSLLDEPAVIDHPDLIEAICEQKPPVFDLEMRTATREIASIDIHAA
jgi:hypothetical protein